MDNIIEKLKGQHEEMEFMYKLYKLKLKFLVELKDKMNNEFIDCKEFKVYKNTFETIEQQINTIKSQIEQIELSKKLFDVAMGGVKNDKRN